TGIDAQCGVATDGFVVQRPDMALHGFDSSAGEMRYEQRGLGDPVVLVHGLYVGASRREYRHVITALAPQFTVYAVDLIGFGNSYAPRTTHTATMHQHLLRDFLIRVVGGPARIVCSGIGCGIVSQLAVYDDPLVERVAMICPQTRPWAHEQPHLSERLTQFFMGTLALGAGIYESVSSPMALREFARSQFADPDRVTDLDRIVHDLLEFAHLPASMYAYLSLLNSYFDVDIFRWIRYMRAPVQVIWGSTLGEPPMDRIHAPAAWSGGRRVDRIDRAGAWAHLERPATVNAALLDFLLNPEIDDPQLSDRRPNTF
ncbi:MAG TPA: alpha/beta fold hydrolase, partial [Tepidisphaeraceae bacterium]|nr:alpha/beta fold hydrolase [Tepidisphaeraceae bacterium]